MPSGHFINYASKAMTKSADKGHATAWVQEDTEVQNVGYSSAATHLVIRTQPEHCNETNSVVE